MYFVLPFGQTMIGADNTGGGNDSRRPSQSSADSDGNSTSGL